MAKVSMGWLFLLVAVAPVGAQTIDLGDPGALEQLRTANPAHYEKVTEIVRGLREQPSRAEGRWLQVTFGAQEVELARMVMLTSDPPKQSLTFKLDDVQYRLRVVRFDLEPVILQNQTLQR